MKDSILGPDAIQWLGVHYKTILASEATNGALSIVDSVSPAQSGPPRHIHHDADETFVILTGECEFWMEGATSYKGAGETEFVPRGTEHTFRVIGSQPCRHLVVLTPGGFERFFSEMARGQYAIPDDMEKIAQIAARYHLTFTGPPLGAGN